MKKVMKSLSVMLLTVALGMSFSSCSGDDHPIIIDTTGSGGTSLLDPEGTVVLNINSTEHTKISNTILLFTNDMKFAVHGLPPSEIVSVGPVAGLGFINTIPQEGWIFQSNILSSPEGVDVHSGHGYLIRENLIRENLTGEGPITVVAFNYIRIYVVGYNDDGSITIKYHKWKMNEPRESTL